MPSILSSIKLIYGNMLFAIENPFSASFSWIIAAEIAGVIGFLDPRSQLAEAYLKHFAGDRFEVYSAGLEPGNLNPTVVEAMKFENIDISENTTNSVNEFIDGHIAFDFVVTVCNETAAERCPYFPGQGKRFHWEQ
jgi:hypothetical protein